MAAAERSPPQHWLKLKLARPAQLLCFAMINMLWPAREGNIWDQNKLLWFVGGEGEREREKSSENHSISISVIDVLVFWHLKLPWNLHVEEFSSTAEQKQQRWPGGMMEGNHAVHRSRVHVEIVKQAQPTLVYLLWETFSIAVAAIIWFPHGLPW